MRATFISGHLFSLLLSYTEVSKPFIGVEHLYSTRPTAITLQSQPSAPRVWFKGMLRWGHALARGRAGRGGATGQADVIPHLVERRVGSEAVGGGGGPRRSRSSM